MEGIVKTIPAPAGDEDEPLRALVFDSYYDAYKGVVAYIRVKEGKAQLGDTIRMMHTGKEFVVTEIGYLRPGGLIPSDSLLAGEVGYLCASIKNVKDCRVGETITNASNPAKDPLPGYKKAVPMVFCGIYPADGSKYGDLRILLKNYSLMMLH